MLYESATILAYLEQTRPERALSPPDVQGKALVDMHVRLCDLQFAPHARAIIFPQALPASRRSWDTQVFAKARPEIEAHLAIVAERTRRTTITWSATVSRWPTSPTCPSCISCR